MMRRRLSVLFLMAGLTIPHLTFALEFTADQITKIDGRTRKAFIYYRDQMWRIEHHSLGPVNVTIVRKDKQVVRSEEHTSELQSRRDLVCRLLLEKKNKNKITQNDDSHSSISMKS